MIDMIVHRHELKKALARLIALLTKRPAPQQASAKTNSEGNGHDRSAAPAGNGHLQAS
jgi:hypothetical protein